MKYLRAIDFVGSQPQLFINNSTVYRTPTGGFLSFFVCIATIASTIYFGREIWEKKNPIVNRAVEILPSPGILALDKDTWDFFFGLEYNNTLYIDDSIYKAKGRIFKNIPTKGLTPTEFSIEPCTNASFKDNTFDYFSSYVYNGAWCISRNQTQDLMLNKLWGQEDFSYIEISLWPCQNSTEKSECKEQSLIEEKLKIATFSVYTLQYQIQTKDYLSPYAASVFNDFFPVSLSTFTHSIIFFMHSETQSDAGWFIEDKQYFYRFSLDRSKLNFYTNSELDGRFLRFQFQLSNMKEIYSRKYIKLQELCAQIGGIAKFLMILGFMLNYFSADFSLKSYLVNHFFDERISRLISKKQEQTHSRRLKAGSISYKHQISKISMKTNDIEDIKDAPTAIQFPCREKLNFSLFQGYFQCCLFKNKHYKKLKMSYQVLRSQLSVENLLENTRSISKLRFILLSNYENDLFDYIGNPLNEDNEQHSLDSDLFKKMTSFIRTHNQQLEGHNLMYSADYIETIPKTAQLLKLIEIYNSRPNYFSNFESNDMIQVQKYSSSNEIAESRTKVNDNLAVYYYHTQTHGEHFNNANKQPCSKNVGVKDSLSFSKVNEEAPNV